MSLTTMNAVLTADTLDTATDVREPAGSAPLDEIQYRDLYTGGNQDAVRGFPIDITVSDAPNTQTLVNCTQDQSCMASTPVRMGDPVAPATLAP